MKVEEKRKLQKQLLADFLSGDYKNMSRLFDLGCKYQLQESEILRLLEESRNIKTIPTKIASLFDKTMTYIKTIKESDDYRSQLAFHTYINMEYSSKEISKFIVEYENSVVDYYFHAFDYGRTTKQDETLRKAVKLRLQQMINFKGKEIALSTESIPWALSVYYMIKEKPLEDSDMEQLYDQGFTSAKLRESLSLADRVIQIPENQILKERIRDYKNFEAILVGKKVYNELLQHSQQFPEELFDPSIYKVTYKNICRYADYKGENAIQNLKSCLRKQAKIQKQNNINTVDSSFLSDYDELMELLENPSMEKEIESITEKKNNCIQYRILLETELNQINKCAKKRIMEQRRKQKEYNATIKKYDELVVTKKILDEYILSYENRKITFLGYCAEQGIERSMIWTHVRNLKKSVSVGTEMSTIRQFLNEAKETLKKYREITDKGNIYYIPRSRTDLTKVIQRVTESMPVDPNEMKSFCYDILLEFPYLNLAQLNEERRCITDRNQALQMALFAGVYSKTLQQEDEVIDFLEINYIRNGKSSSMEEKIQATKFMKQNRLPESSFYFIETIKRIQKNQEKEQPKTMCMQKNQKK